MPIPPKVSRTINAYWRAFGSYTPQIILISVLSIVSSFFEGVGVTAIIPVFSFVGGSGATGLPTDTISKFIASSYHFLGFAYSFRNLLIGIAILFVLRIIFIFGIQFISASMAYSYERDTRRALFSTMLSAKWPYLSRQNMGHLEQLLTTNIIYASQLFLYISTTILIIAKTMMYVTIAVNVSLWAAVMSIVVGGVVFLILRPLFYRTRVIGMQAETNNRSLAHFVAEHVAGMKALKAMAVEDEVEKGGESYFERVRAFNVGILSLRTIIGMTIQFAGILFIAAVFTIMYKSPGFSVAAFAVIVYAINQIFSQVQTGQSQLHGFGSMTPYLMRILSTRDEAEGNKEQSNGNKTFEIERLISFRNISFSYPNRSETLSGVSFDIHKGEIIALIGQSGAGKTTIADILLRLVDPTSGSIVVDGMDVQDISLHEWRSHIGYVPQDSILLNDTIERNITFYDDAISHEDAVQAAKAANIHDFIESLPQKYQTIIGDRGILISGGQRQRIALARALARKPELLVLDEATSSLDSESENAIKKSVEDLRGKTSIMVIAHRMSSISSADRIVVLEAGRVVETGAPDELRAKPGSYYARILQSGASKM
jgi:ABC-type multidrug transport system fused ATPase/permease subunit